MTTSGPLDGYRVIEFGSNLTAPIATMYLGDQGADVIKIETPAGDQLRSSGDSRKGIDGLATMFVNANRNKRSVVLDLKDMTQRDAALQLAAQCDVVVQNFRPAVIDRLGLGYEALRVLREDIIYVSVDGLGRSGPAAGRRVYDTVVQGIAGIAAVQADPVTGRPAIVQNAIADKVTALFIFQAVTAALLVRERSGQGQHVHVSMLNAALSFIWPETMGKATYLGQDVVRGASLSGSRICHATSDGFLVLGYVTSAEFKALCEVLDCEDLLLDPRFATLSGRYTNAALLNERLGHILSTRTTADWLDRLGRADAVYAPVNGPDDIATDPQIRAIGALEDYDHPVAGAYRQPVHPIQFSGTPATLHRHAPVLGADTADVIREFGLSIPENEA